MTELQLWPDTDGPTTFFPAVARATLGTEISVISGTWWLKELRVWRGSWDMIGPIRARLYRVDSPTVGTPVPGTDVTIHPRGLGWQVARLRTPVLLVTGQAYRPGYRAPNGACATLNYF